MNVWDALFSTKPTEPPRFDLLWYGSLFTLLAVFDTNRFQLQNKQYAKFVFDCQLLDGQFQENQEVAELGFFDISALPPLSEKRITKEQMDILWQVYQGERKQYVD